MRERADPCHKTDDLRLELVRVLCVALHFVDEELRVRFFTDDIAIFRFRRLRQN